MVSVQDSGSGGLGSSPGQGTALCSWARHFIVTVPLSTRMYKWVPANLLLGGNPAMDQHPIQGEQKYSQSLHVTETGISSGLMGHLARNTDFTFFLFKTIIIIVMLENFSQFFLVFIALEISLSALSATSHTSRTSLTPFFGPLSFFVNKKTFFHPLKVQQFFSYSFNKNLKT